MSPEESLDAEQVRALLLQYYPEASLTLASRLKVYLDLLLRWNGRTNLTSIRDPREIVQRHFGESLFVARYLPDGAGTLLDVGSGAGFPGLPIALARPDWKVTLAESQGKKAAFLMEVVRTLGTGIEVWPKRVEMLASARRFRVVTLRAVDRTSLALEEARARVAEGGWLLHLDGGEPGSGLPIPGSTRRVLRVESRETASP